jgi:uncharacterized protein YcbK (DUF882 family)
MGLRYFKPAEFACPCCGADEMDAAFVRRLDEVRHVVGEPLKVNSGRRCPKHNKRRGGVPGGAHTKGLAADLHATTGSLRFKIVNAAILLEVRRIGIAKTFVHLDADPDAPQGVVWLY